MLPHQIVCDKVADALVERGRAFQVSEQERQARDLEPLVRVERVGLVDVAERLIGEQSFGGDERLARPSRSCSASPAIHSAGRTRRRAVFERQPQRPGPQFDGAGRRRDLIEYHRQCLPFARRLALDVDELRAVRHRIEHDDEIGGQLD